MKETISMKKRDYFIHGALALMLFIGFIYGLFFFTLHNAGDYLTGMAVFTPQMPADCSDAAIRALWESVFEEGSAGAIISASTAQPGKCTYFSAYKVNGNDELYYLRGRETLDPISGEIIIAWLRANVSQPYITLLETAPPQISKDPAQIVPAIYLKSRTASAAEAGNAFGRAFKIPPQAWETETASGNQIYIFKESGVAANLNKSNKGIVLQSYSMDAYYFVQASAEFRPGAPIISSELSAISLNQSTPKQFNLAPYVADFETPDSQLAFSFFDKDHVTITLQGTTITITPVPLNWTGSDNVTIVVTDTDSLSATKQIKINVLEPTPNRPPTINSVVPGGSNVVMNVGEIKVFSHASADPDGDTLKTYWKYDNRSPAASLNSSFSLSASAVGGHTLTLIVTDGKANATRTWHIEVAAADNPPVLLKQILMQQWNPNTKLEDAFDLDDYFSDPENHSLAYSYEGNKNIAIKINNVTHKVSFYPKTDWAGTEVVRFIADDGSLRKKSNNVTLKVGKVAKTGCEELWDCTEWQPAECPETKIKRRTCNDINSCGTTAKKPLEERACAYIGGENETRYKVYSPGGIDAAQTGASLGDEEVQLSPGDGLGRGKMIFFLVSFLTLGGLLSFVGLEKVKSSRHLNKEKASKAIPDTSLLRLTDYIRRELQDGYTVQQIRARLLYEGWNDYIIQKAFWQLNSIRAAATQPAQRRAPMQPGAKQTKPGMQPKPEKQEPPLESNQVKPTLESKLYTKKEAHDKMKAFET